MCHMGTWQSKWSVRGYKNCREWWRAVSKKKTFTNACVLFTCKITLIIIHPFIIHRFSQWVFANFCYRFQPFFAHRYFHRDFQMVLLKKFSQTLFIGFFTGFFRGVCWAIFWKFVHRFFHRVFQTCLLSNFWKICSQVFSQAYFSHRFFHRVLNFEIFSKFRLCKIHRVFHRVFSCHRVFHIFFTAFSQVFIQ